MKRIRLINLILIMFCCCNMLAQNITVTGQVVDVTSEPIIGASVVVKGTTNGTITDFDGNFTLSVQKGETLHISYIGYVAQDVKVMGNQPVKVVMAEDTETLDEVVVVGTSMKKSDLTGAVASVSSKVLEEKPVTNVNQALQGRVAGVFISQPTRPTDDASIKIIIPYQIGNSKQMFRKYVRLCIDKHMFLLYINSRTTVREHTFDK